jgi:hypothetical protein
LVREGERASNNWIQDRRGTVNGFDAIGSEDDFKRDPAAAAVEADFRIEEYKGVTHLIPRALTRKCDI